MRFDRVKEIRDLRGLSQEDLANRCGMSASQIFNIETGRSQPSADSTALLARALEVSTDYLLGLVDEPTGYLREESLTPMERRLIWAYRKGLIVEAFKTLATMAEEVDEHKFGNG